MLYSIGFRASKTPEMADKGEVDSRGFRYTISKNPFDPRDIQRFVLQTDNCAACQFDLTQHVGQNLTAVADDLQI